MKHKILWGKILSSLFGIALIVLFVYSAYRIVVLFISLLAAADPTVAAAIGAAVIAVFSSVLTIMLARYYESKREREAAHRDKKTDLYNDFLKELFTIFLDDTQRDSRVGTLVPYLREVQRKLILWSGPGVIKSYAEWHEVLTSQGNKPKATSLIKMIDFFLALRKDLGHSNKGIKRDHLVRFLLRNPSLFMNMYKSNPQVLLSEIADAERIKAE